MGAETCVRPTALLHAVTMPSSTAEYLRIYELGLSFNNVRTCSWFCQTTPVEELQAIGRSSAWPNRFLGGFPCYRKPICSEPDSRDYLEPLDMCLDAGGWSNDRRSFSVDFLLWVLDLRCPSCHALHASTFSPYVGSGQSWLSNGGNGRTVFNHAAVILHFGQPRA